MSDPRLTAEQKKAQEYLLHGGCLHLPYLLDPRRDMAVCDCGVVEVPAIEAFDGRSKTWNAATLAFARATFQLRADPPAERKEPR